MVDRYQDRPFPADDDRNRRADQHAPVRAEGDPLAELARLIGQTDPVTTMSRANLTAQPRGSERQPQPPAADDVPPIPAGPPPWMQRATRQERHEPPPLPEQDYPSQDHASQDHTSRDYPSQDRQDLPNNEYPSAVHPLHRYAAPRTPVPEPAYQDAPPFADAGHDHESDPSRYDEALYGRLDSGGQEPQYGEAYADDPYGYQDGYDDAEEEPVRKRRGGMMTVVIVLALAVVGTGAAFAYRTFVGSPRGGEPPIIRADSGPTKIMPAPVDATQKLPDRMATGDGQEKIVPREEAPVDVNTRSVGGNAGPRVVFPSLNPNSNPPPPSSVASNSLPPSSAGNGTLPSNEPRKIRTLSVKGDQPDAAATPVGAAPPSKPAPPTRSAAVNANASANAPLSLTPQAAPPVSVTEPRARVAATTPVPEPAIPAPAAAAAGSGFLVQLSSQRNEADAQASFRALQSKFPTQLGSRSAVIKRVDLGEKGIYFRAMVGPFASSDEATQFCGGLKTAGGQCVIPRN
jgi:hypothetical protein